MLDKIIFTKDPNQRNIPQLEFEMPVGYKLYAPVAVDVSTTEITRVDMGIRIYSDKPATVIFTPAVQSIDFRIVDPIQMLPPMRSTELGFGVINPIPGGDDWILREYELIAVMQVVQTYQVKLFELSNKAYKQYE